jgi:hypothetical protein
MLALLIATNGEVLFLALTSGITSLPNFIQIDLAVLDLNHADRQTLSALDALV